MDTDPKKHLPSILVVAPNPDRREFFEAALSPFYRVTFDDDADQVISANDPAHCDDPAQVIVIDQNGRTDPNNERYIAPCERLKTKSPGLVATASPDLSFDLREVGSKYRLVFLTGRSTAENCWTRYPM